MQTKRRRRRRRRRRMEGDGQQTGQELVSFTSVPSSAAGAADDEQGLLWL
jgi:hypothetical protein